MMSKASNNVVKIPFSYFQELDGFDSSIFWTAGLLWKFFSTCGVETWDRDFGELVVEKKVIEAFYPKPSIQILPPKTSYQLNCFKYSMKNSLCQVGHYKNWREWAHTVHNLDKEERPRKREEGRREDYARDKR